MSWGAGPRASQYLVLAAKARAVLHGRYYVSTDDIRAVAGPVLRHRIVTNFNAEAEGLKPDDIVKRLIKASPSTSTRPSKVENYQKYLNPQTLASLEGLDLQARLVVEGYVAGHAPQPVPRLLGRVRRAPRVRPGRRHPPRRLEGLVEDRQALPQAVRGGDEPPARTCCWTPASRWPTPRARTSRSSSTPSSSPRRWRYMVLQQQDSVGLATFDDVVRRYLKPAGQPSHLKELLHVMDAAPARAKSDLGAVFHDLAERFKKRGVVVDPLRPLRRRRRGSSPGLKHFRHRRHEVIVFHILDPAELDFPFREHDALQGAGRPARGPDRAPRPPPGLPERARRVPRRAEEGMPDDRHRLRPAADRPGARRAALELPGVAGDAGAGFD